MYPLIKSTLAAVVAIVCICSSVEAQETNAPNFKYLVSVQRRSKRGIYEQCSIGSIVGRKHVLTSADCFFDEKGKLEASTFRLQVEIRADTANNKREHVRTAYLAKDLKDSSKYAGIAIIQLFDSLSLSRIIGKIDLPRRFENKHLRVIDDSGDGLAALKYNSSLTRGISTVLTKNYYRVMKARNSPQCRSNDAVTCVQFTNVDCAKFLQGDSGMPLVRGMELVGISINPLKSKVCNPSATVVPFTKISGYFNFIERSLLDTRHKYKIVTW